MGEKMKFAIDYSNKLIMFICISPIWIFFALLIAQLNVVVWIILLLIGLIFVNGLYRYIVFNVFKTSMWKGYLFLLLFQLISLTVFYYSYLSKQA